MTPRAVDWLESWGLARGPVQMLLWDCSKPLLPKSAGEGGVCGRDDLQITHHAAVKIKVIIKP